MTTLHHESDTKPLFTRGPSLGTRLVVLAALSIVLMFLDHQRGHLETVRETLSVAIYPIRVLVDLPFAAAGRISEHMTGRDTLLAENERLRHEQLAANVRLQRFAALQAENERLRALLDSSAQVSNRVLIAEVLAQDLDPFRHRVVINKGSREQAYRGQALLDAHGIVGQITRANPLSAEAILISDPDHAVPVEVNRNGLRTIAVGTGDIARLELPHLPNNADVQVDDLLVSSGLGGHFPSGYPVARITAVKRDPGAPFAVVTAEPTAALNRIHEVLLVWSQPPAEAAPGSTVEETPPW